MLLRRSPLLDSLNIGWPEVLDLDEKDVQQLLERLEKAQEGTVKFLSKRGPIF